MGSEPRDTGAPWTVALVCGASGVGKSSVAGPLARRYGAALIEADDLQAAVRAVTTPQSHPALHAWDLAVADARRTGAGGPDLSPDRIAALHAGSAEALRPAFAAVIAERLAAASRTVVEGDYLLPGLVRPYRSSGAVRAVVLGEPDAAAIAGNYRLREPQDGEQTLRAAVSVLVGDWLARLALAEDVPVVASRPWADVLDRVDAALRDQRA